MFLVRLTTIGSISADLLLQKMQAGFRQLAFRISLGIVSFAVTA
jgi:hypothetical protein